MKPGRNDPCPCGSGIKYKKCCYLKGDSPDSQALPDTQEDIELRLKEMENMIALRNNLRKLTLNRKPHIKKYYKIRKLHSTVVSSMLEYEANGKFKQVTQPVSLPSDKTDPVYIIHSEFDFDTREGLQAFADMVVYKHSPNTNCITEEFIKNHRYRKPEKKEFLQSLLDSRLGLFEIIGIDYSEGYAYLRDVFTGEEYTVTDIGLSGNENFDDLYMYTRLIEYHGITFNSGLSLIFNKDDPFIKKHIQTYKKDFSLEGEPARFLELYNHFRQISDRVRIIPNSYK